VLSPEGMRRSFRRHQTRMKQSPFPHPRLCCPRATSGTTGSPPPCRPSATSPTAYTRPSLPERTTADPGPARASPLPAPTFPTMPLPLPRGVHDRCNPGSPRRPWPSPRIPGLGSPLSPRTGLASRGGRIHLTLRPGRSLPPTGPSTLGSDAGRFPPTPPACYPAPWRLPGPDFHRLADASSCSDQITLRHHLRTVGTQRPH
jgi:hypothetical protein